MVYARSIFLQGVLLSDAADWPLAGNYDANAYVRTLQHFTKRFERQNVADLCVAYVRAQDWICSLVVGCETPDQLKRNLEIFCLPPLQREQCAELEEACRRLLKVSSTRATGTQKFMTISKDNRVDISSLFRLDGRVAFLSGATGLLGRPMAVAMAHAGAHVVLNVATIGSAGRAAS